MLHIQRRWCYINYKKSCQHYRLNDQLYPVLSRFGKTTTYPVSDMDAGAIRIRYALDTSADVSKYFDNFHTSRYALIRLDTPLISPRYIHDIFSRYFGGFGQEYAPDTRRYVSIHPWWNLYYVLCVAIRFQLFIYQ
jgi:hypothetical protein